ncbi:MAG: glycoside hydrolase family 57 protein [Chlorobi bacterium]|nr:glycoside hydrolase family 57 protein [Chlorobiota bacterium]
MNHRLRVAILWHFHQPDYRVGNQAVLPWVRLHATKDYAELPAIHRDFPTLRLTYNVTPILAEQLDDYCNGRIEDECGVLSAMDRATAGDDERLRLLRWAFVGNAERMINPYVRYRQLRDDAANDKHKTWGQSEWRDLQVWMRLTWLGETARRIQSVENMLARGRDFTSDDRERLVALERCLLVAVFQRLRNLVRGGSAELATSPYYHPILPLVCSSDAIKQSDSDIEPLEPPFSWRCDAVEHTRRALDAMQRYFRITPRGMWLSEGGISDDALDVLAECGIEWTASDCAILRRTLGDRESDQCYRPFVWKRNGRRIAVLFRNSELSDAIGFVYSTWNARDAVADFVERLRRIRTTLIQQHGRDFLRTAVVPVILDGENCWEYYERNGEPFLRALYDMLSKSEEFETVTFSDVAQQALADHSTTTLDHIVAGSWIGGSFRIWIGHPDDRRAWEILREARTLLDTHARFLDPSAYALAYRHLLTAEGSDWFWWFGDEHRSAFQHVFDELFRYHVVQAYHAMGQSPPTELSQPIMTASAYQSPFSAMHPVSLPTQFQHGD